MSTLRFPVAIPTLVTESVSLRQLDEEDIPSWFQRATDVESADLAGDPIPMSQEMGVSWLEKHRDQFRNKVGLRWAIVPRGSAVSVGTVGLVIKSGNEQCADLGVVVARSWWSKGLGGAAIRMVTRYAFSEVGLSEIRAEVLQRNRASIRLLEKTGFNLARVLPATASEPEVLLRYTLSRGGASAA
jgi:[ribosomal protein S5]-alanine N-acetyltransferase